MKKSMKQTWVLLAAALVVAAVMGCASSQSHFEKGGTALRNKDFDSAIAEFTEEIRLNPENAKAYFQRGYAYAQKGDLESAIADFEKVREIDPDLDPAAKDMLKKTRQQLAERPATQQASASNSPAATAPAAKSGVADELDLAIRDASDYLNDNIPQGSKIVILNIESVSANLSEYIIDELIANAVNDKTFSVVDRRQLEAIQSEQKFQMSGAVDDKDALAIGKFFGAQTIISGAMREIGGRYRLTIRALAVQTAQVQGQYNRNMAISETLAGLAGSGGGGSTYRSATQTTSAGTTQASSTTAVPPAPTTQAVVEPPIQGIMVPGESLTEKLAWLSRAADSHNTYILEVTADESIAPHKFQFSGGINITVVLRGDNVNRTIRLKSNGTMFTISDKNVTFILDNNITLMGHNGNTDPLVFVGYSGIFRMRSGATITGNSNVGRGGNGGGVWNYNGTFEMTGGTISGNTAKDGGGVCVVSGTFTMQGGTITGNTARNVGGGVYGQSPKFVKTGGTITGYNSDQTNGNAVRDEDGNILARKGYAIYTWGVSSSARKETTSGPKANLSVGGSKGKTGDWDD